MRSGNRVMIKTQDNIDLLAAHYVDEILQARPEGPYLIGGNCQAAQIAFQIASRLASQGHEISLLILQEKFVPFPYEGPVALLFGERSMYNPFRYFRQPEAGWRKYYSGPLRMTPIPGGHGEFFREPNVQVLTQIIGERIAEACTGEFKAWLPVSGRTGQRLPEEACRAALTGPAQCRARPGEVFSVAVTVRNLGRLQWQPGAVSGLYLANRWLEKDGRVAIGLDGRTLLHEVLASSEAVVLTLEVKAPEQAGEWILELDMVDEGVAWFQERGSTPLRVPCSVAVTPDF